MSTYNYSVLACVELARVTAKLEEGFSTPFVTTSRVWAGSLVRYDARFGTSWSRVQISAGPPFHSKLNTRQ